MLLLGACFLAAGGCGDPGSAGADGAVPADAPPRADADAGPLPDAASPDAEAPDASPRDAASSDASAPDAGRSCAGRQPVGATRAARCWDGVDRDCTSYAAVFGSFPGTRNSIELFQASDTYVAMEIDTTGLTADRGTWIFDTPQGFVVDGQGPKLMTLSRCPGDFDRAAIEAEMGPDCYERVENLTTLRWKRAGTSGRRCALEPGRTYYLNVFYTMDPAGTPPAELRWSCHEDEDAARCGNLMASAW
jgi:hypothetical protein